MGLGEGGSGNAAGAAVAGALVVGGSGKAAGAAVAGAFVVGARVVGRSAVGAGAVQAPQVREHRWTIPTVSQFRPEYLPVGTSAHGMGTPLLVYPVPIAESSHTLGHASHVAGQSVEIVAPCVECVHIQAAALQVLCGALKPVDSASTQGIRTAGAAVGAVVAGALVEGTVVGCGCVGAPVGAAAVGVTGAGVDGADVAPSMALGTQCSPVSRALALLLWPPVSNSPRFSPASVLVWSCAAAILTLERYRV